MPIDRRMSDAIYHHRRVEQERRCATYARTAKARESHAALMRLHESMRDGMPLPV